MYQNGQDLGWMEPFERLRTERNGEKWLPGLLDRMPQRSFRLWDE